MNTKTPNMIIGIIVFFVIVAALIPTLTASGDALGNDAQCAASGYFWNSSTETCRVANVTDPATTGAYANSGLGTLFSSDTGIILVILLGGLLLFVYKKMKSEVR